MGGLYLLNGTRYWITGTLGRFSDGITTGIVIFFAIFILRTLLRRDWIAAIAGALIFSSQQQDLANALDWQVQLVVYILLFSVIIFVMLRLGLVATIASIFAINLINGITLGTDWTTWYAPTGLATMLMATAVAGWAFRQSLGDRELV
jgi:hypothetical protein